MGAKADHDLWGQALAFERLYGDDAPSAIARKVEQLQRDGEDREAAFWCLVGDCLRDLHAMRFPDMPAKPVRDEQARPQAHLPGAGLERR